MDLLIRHPALPCALAGVFLGLYWVSRQRAVGITALAWLVYAAYETGMRRRWLCTGECNIRIDLLLLYPLLLGLSVFALVSFGRWLAGRQSRA